MGTFRDYVMLRMYKTGSWQHEIQASIEWLQYLRGIAALMVVSLPARHYFGDVSNWTIFGSTGIDIFFVISGFIMAHSTKGISLTVARIIGRP